ncbi:MAG: S1 RNA-binding domain-containing protein [Phycisphaerae bacterium]|nr:S1 RNA-binding domain-containing protein [Phycisphaerae bacterium]
MSNDPNSGAVPPAPSAPESTGIPFAPAPAAAPPRSRADADAALEAEISAALGNMSVEDLLEDRSPKGASGATGRTGGGQSGGGQSRGSGPRRGSGSHGGQGHGGGPARGGRQIRTGKVFRIHAGDIFVEFGPRSQGVCPLSQFPEPPTIGEEMEFAVERLDAFEGLLVLSRPGAVQKADWGNLEIGQIVEARCTGMNKGGLEMEVAHHKGFMPAGMVDLRHIPDISVLIGEKFPCEIVELNKDKGRLILSRKSVLVADRAAKRDELLNELEEGQVRPATIISIQPYGAFADLGGIDGLIHISDLTHERIKHPSEVVKEGEVVQVRIRRIDRSGDAPKISLSRKDTMSDPISSTITAINAGDTVTGRVSRVTEFGAFIELAPGVDGLVHISEISHDRIGSVEQVLKKDEIVTCKVLSIDAGRKRVSLSIKAMQSAPERAERPDRGGPGGKRGRTESSEAPRNDDPALRKLKARLNVKATPQLKGGIG